MENLDLSNGPEAFSKPAVSLEGLAELTGFPLEYIKRELFQDNEIEKEMSLEELRIKVLTYLDSSFN